MQQIIMPKLGLTMTVGTIVEWHHAVGDRVTAGEVLCTYETEKVTLELEAPADGMLAEVLAPAGTVVPAGEVVCVVATSLETPAAMGAQAADKPATAAVWPHPGTVQSLPAEAPKVDRHEGTRGGATPKARAHAARLAIDWRTVAGRGPGGRVHAADVTAASGQVAGVGAGSRPTRATPLARRVAAAEGVDLSGVRGTGPDGVVTRDDVEQARRATGARALQPGETVVPLSPIRQVIGARMAQSAFSAPHVTLMTEAEATNLVSARQQLNQELPPADRVSYNTLLAALVARGLAEHPQLNARLAADGIHLLPQVNIALAVDTERGLMTPVLRDVSRLSLLAIQRGYNALAERALTGRSLPADFEEGTFTLTNLGSLEIDGFTPIINPPQAAILGVGRIVEKPVARDGAVVVRAMITLSLSFDHRMVDGTPAARFLQRIKQLVERPIALLLQSNAGPAGAPLR